MAYTAQQRADVTARIMREAADPAEVWRRIGQELPGVEIDDVLIAGRLRQARIHMANDEWPSAPACAVQLARDLTGLGGIAPPEAWTFLRRLNNPMVAEFIRLFDETPGSG